MERIHVVTPEVNEDDRPTLPASLPRRAPRKLLARPTPPKARYVKRYRPVAPALLPFFDADVEAFFEAGRVALETPARERAEDDLTAWAYAERRRQLETVVAIVLAASVALLVAATLPGLAGLVGLGSQGG